MAEADALYVGIDGKIHVDEVKHTANALVEKMRSAARKKQSYLGRMSAWVNAGSNDRVAGIVIATEERWSALFSVVVDDSALQHIATRSWG